MKTDPSDRTRGIRWHKNAVMVAGGIVVGLLLARSAMISPETSFFVLAAGTLLCITLLLRKTEVLVFVWFVLTSLVWPITAHWVPGYFAILGRAIFWGILACVLVAWVVDNILSKRKFVSFDHMGMKAVLALFILWGIVTLFTTVDLDTSLKRFFHIIIGLFTSYIFYDFFCRDERNIKIVLVVLFFVTIVVSAIAVAIAVHSLVSGIPVYKKISLWFWNPNALGQLLSSTVPLLIASSIWFVPNKRLRLASNAIMLLALFFSFSRTCWLATAATLAYLSWRSRPTKIPLAVMVLLCIFISALLFPVFGGDVADYIMGQRFSGRREIWRAAWGIACDYPLFGVGPGNVLLLMGRYLSPGFVSIIGIEDTHSLYLKNAAEMGFMSVALWIAVVTTFVWSSVKIERRIGLVPLGFVSRGVTATFIGIAVHGIFENGFFMTPFVAGEFHVLLPYILLAIPFAAEKIQIRGSGPQGRDPDMVVTKRRG